MDARLSSARSQFQGLDWPRVVDLATQGQMLIAAHPGTSTPARAWRLQGELMRRAATFRTADSIPWRVAVEPPRLSNAQVAVLSRLGQLFERFLAAVTAVLPHHEALRSFVGFPIWPEEAALLAGLGSARPVFFRLDVMPDADGELQVLELQTVSGGMGITTALREVYGPDPRFPGLPELLGPALFREVQAWRHCRGLPELLRPVAGVLVNAENDYRYELLTLASRLAEVELVVSPWRVSRGVQFPSLADGRRPDLLFRFFQTPAILASRSAFKRQLVEQIARGELQMLNPWVDLWDDKRLLALVHHPLVNTWLGAALDVGEVAWLRQHVPDTWLLTPTSLSELIGKPRADRGVYLKRGRSAMARGMIDGQQENRHRFDELAKAAAQAKEWVVQRAVRGKPWSFEYLDTSDSSLKTMQGYVRLSPFYVRLADGTMQLADVSVTARPSRSRVHGAADACLVVPVGQ